MYKFICIVATILAVLVILALSWGVTCGVVYLICLCFDLTFKWAWATGIWLIMFLVKACVGGTKSAS